MGISEDTPINRTILMVPMTIKRMKMFVKAIRMPGRIVPNREEGRFSEGKRILSGKTITHIPQKGMHLQEINDEPIYRVQ
jgi:hypothetical protein